MKKIMKISAILIITIAFMLSLSSCQLWISIFGPDQNNILQWMPTSGISQGTKETFKFTGTGGYQGYTGVTTFTFGLINTSDTMISMKVTITSVSGYYMSLLSPGTAYINASSSEKGIYWSQNSIIVDTSDVEILSAPVKTGMSWISGGTTNFEIQSTGTKVDVAAGSYSDVVVVQATNSSWYTGETLTFYWSVKQGLIKIDDSLTYEGTPYEMYEELASVTSP